MAGYFDVQINYILLTMVVLAKLLVKESTVNDFRGTVASTSSIRKSCFHFMQEIRFQN